MIIKVLQRPLVLVLLLSLLIYLVGCSSAPGQSDGNKPSDYTKEQITAKLAANKEATKAVWSPDGKSVIYIQRGNSQTKELDKAYLWKVGEQEAKPVKHIKPTFNGFSWSPDNKHFLISEKAEEETENVIIQADNLKEEAYKIKSNSIPIWSPDGKSLAYGYEWHFNDTYWGSLQVYTLGHPKSEYIWKAINYSYKVENRLLLYIKS